MSDCGPDYAETEYQETIYQSSEEERGVEELVEEEQEDENEPGPSDGNATEEAAPRVQISETVLRILQERWPSWKGAKGKKRSTVWKALVVELRCLPENLTMDQARWDLHLKVSGIQHMYWSSRCTPYRPTLDGCISKVELE